MPEPTGSRKSNAERGLERHADPRGPQFPLLKSVPKLPNPQEPSNRKPRRKKVRKNVDAYQSAATLIEPPAVVEPARGESRSTGCMRVQLPCRDSCAPLFPSLPC